MTLPPRSRVVALASFCAASVVLLVARAAADVEAAYLDQTTWTFTVTHVPDFDQKRTALPNDGKMYCVPTSALNWMAYFANHGRPSLAPGPGWWQLQSKYPQATANLAVLGALMGTHPNNGTNTSGAMFGFNLWLAGHPAIVLSSKSNIAWSPTFQDAGMFVMNGAYVMVIVGWYEDLGSGFITRVGGHALTLNYGARSGNSMLIGWRDPGSDQGDWTTQSTFSTEEYPIVDQLVMPLNYGIFPRPMSKVVGYGSGYIDSLYVILPLFAVTPGSDPWSFFIYKTFKFDGSPVPDIVEFESAEMTKIVDMELHPDVGSFLYVAESPDPDDPPKLWRLDPVTGLSALVPVDLVWPRDVLVSRLRDLYVLDGSDLVMFRIDTDPPEELARVTPPVPIATLTYDDDADEVVLLSQTEQWVLYYPHQLDEEPVIRPITPWLPLVGEVSFCHDRVNECLWLVCDTSDAMYRLVESMVSGHLVAQEITHPMLVDPMAINTNDEGHVFVSTPQGILEFMHLPETGEWILVPDGWFDDAPAGRFLTIAKSRSNFDPAIHVGPAWHHVLPTEFSEPIFDCPGDLNGDGLVDGADLGLLLANWGGPGIGDLDWNGAVDGADLGIMLGEWGNCPGLAACPPDLDGNGEVDGADLGLLLGNWGGLGTGDFDANGIVDGADLGLLLGAWGDCP